MQLVKHNNGFCFYLALFNPATARQFEYDTNAKGWVTPAQFFKIPITDRYVR